MAVKRFDTSGIAGVEKTPQGGLRIPARPTKVGVFVYLNGDGSERRELRPPEEVFRADSLASLRGATVTNLHPPVPITADNFRQYSVGHVSDAVIPDPDGMHVSAPLFVQDAESVGQVNSGERKELSCGYECDVDPTPGIWQGQRFDVVQRNIVYNHVALGPSGWGRAGASASLRLDSSDAIQVFDKTVNEGSEGSTMKTIKIDGIDYEVGSEAHLQAVARRDSSQQQQIRDQETKIGALTADLASAVSRADKVEKDLKEAKDPKALHALVVKRADMIDKYRRIAKIKGVRVDDAATEGAAEGDLIAQCLKMMDPEFNPEGKSPDFIAGYFVSRLAALLGDEEAEQAEGMEAVEEAEGADNGIPGTPPLTSAGRSDARTGRRLDSAGARAVASRETGSGASVVRGTTADRDNPSAARQRLREDSLKAWERPLAMSKDK